MKHSAGIPQSFRNGPEYEIRNDLFNLAKSFPRDMIYIQFTAIFGKIEDVNRLVYEADSRLSSL
jgi:hypothetical protein